MRGLRRVEPDNRRRVRRTHPVLRGRLPGVLQAECTACPVRHWGTRILDYGAAGIVIVAAKPKIISWRKDEHHGDRLRRARTDGCPQHGDHAIRTRWISRSA